MIVLSKVSTIAMRVKNRKFREGITVHLQLAEREFLYGSNCEKYLLQTHIVTGCRIPRMLTLEI